MLDEYQYDDEETTDLLNAIRSWNLKPRSPVQSPECHNDGGSSSLGSTILTSTDIDTITAGSTTTSKLTASSAVKIPRTPLCNYSSKPSSLTARILDRELSTPPIHRIHSAENKDENNKIFIQNPSLSSPCRSKHSDGDSPGTRTREDETDKNTTRKRNGQGKENRKPEASTSKSLPQYVTTKEKKLESIQDKSENEDALRILRATAAELGLGNNELQAVLPTVQKLVKVITEHVPRLENFVEEVCQVVVENDEVDADTEKVTDKDKSFKTPPRKEHMKRRRNRKNMGARKARMDSAVRTLRENWHLKKKNMLLKDKTARVVESHGTTANESAFVYEEDYQSYGLFTTAVKDKLSRNAHVHAQPQQQERESLVSPLRTPISSNTVHKPAITDSEALQEINRLVEFEEKYSKRVNALMNGEDDVSNAPSVDSPPHSDTVLHDLLNADKTTLRRFVLHFAYLFSARQDGILEKMNDLYVFSHEATTMINGVKKAMGLSQNCPIHSVARKVLAVIESQKGAGSCASDD